MTTRKRSAEDELTSCSVIIIKPVQVQDSAPTPAHNNMNSTRGFLKRAWNWFMSWLPPLSTYTSMTYGTTEKVVAETYVQSSDTRIDNTTALKRKKIRHPKTTRPRSAEDGYRKSGRGKMDISHWRTDVERRQAIDEFWRPREHSLLRKKTTTIPQPQLPPPQTSLKETSTPGIPLRRHSDSSESPMASNPSPFGNELFILHPNKPSHAHTAKALNTVLPLPKLRPDDPTKKVGIEEQLGDLLLAKPEEKERLFLTPSSAKERQRIEVYERREQEKAELRKKREEEKKQAELEAKRALRLNRRQPNKRLVQPLSKKWEDKINYAQFTQNLNEVLSTSIGGTQLASKDFRTLLGRGHWLNDEIINSYIEWVVDAANKTATAEAAARGEPPTKVPKFIAHNSFFYENLTKKGPSSTDRLMKRKGAPGESLLEVDSLFVPICRGSHWTVGVVRPVARTIEYFDSFGGKSKPFIAEMRAWLKHQLGDSYVADEWSEPRTACAKQSNGYDCGVFVCTNAFCVAFGLETSSYVERDMTQQRRNIAAVLINRGFVGDFLWENWGL